MKYYRIIIKSANKEEIYNAIHGFISLENAQDYQLGLRQGISLSGGDATEGIIQQV